MIERREGERHVVPEIYRKYIALKVRRPSGEFMPVKLLDFSPKGIRIKSPYGIPVDSEIECLISAPKSITKDVPFIGEIKYCIVDEFDGDYLMGAEIIETSDRLGFEIFSEVHAHLSASTVVQDQVTTLGGHLTSGIITSVKVVVVLGVIEESNIRADLDPRIDQVDVKFSL